MKKRNISSKITVYIIVTFFIISMSLLQVVADSGKNNGDGSGDTNPPSPPPIGPNNETDGNAYNNTEQNQDQNTDNKDEEQNREENQYEEQNAAKNQSSNQKRIGENDVSGKKMRYQQREMKMVNEKNRTRIRSEWDQEEYEDEFEILFDIDQEPSLMFNYKNNMHSSENDLSFEVKIIELIEYRDSNKNGKYDEEDIIASTYSLGGSKFINISFQHALSDDGKQLHQVSTQTEDDVFKMNIYHSGNYSLLGNQILSPSEIKIDFIINNYPFEEDSTQLALRTMLETQHEIKLNTESFDEMQGFSKNESVLDITTLNDNGFFSWAETVDVDNVTNKVHSTIQSQIIETIEDDVKISNKVSNIYFSYPRGSNIVHDPKLGVVSISFETFSLQSIGNLINMDNILLYVGICILASIMFLGVIAVRKRI